MGNAWSPEKLSAQQLPAVQNDGARVRHLLLKQSTGNRALVMPGSAPDSPLVLHYVPTVLRVRSPNGQPACEGMYVLVDDMMPQGMPLWKNDKEKWLFSSTDGTWNIGGSKTKGRGFACHSAHIFSGRKHHGLMPHQVAGVWWRAGDGKFCQDRAISVTDADGANSVTESFLFPPFCHCTSQTSVRVDMGAVNSELHRVEERSDNGDIDLGAYAQAHELMDAIPPAPQGSPPRSRVGAPQASDFVGWPAGPGEPWERPDAAAWPVTPAPERTPAVSAAHAACPRPGVEFTKAPEPAGVYPSRVDAHEVDSSGADASELQPRRKEVAEEWRLQEPVLSTPSPRQWARRSPGAVSPSVSVLAKRFERSKQRKMQGTLPKAAAACSPQSARGGRPAAHVSGQQVLPTLDICFWPSLRDRSREVGITFCYSPLGVEFDFASMPVKVKSVARTIEAMGVRRGMAVSKVGGMSVGDKTQSEVYALISEACRRLTPRKEARRRSSD